MRPITLLCTTFLACAGLSAQTLDGYLAIALENSPGLAAKQAGYQAALQKIPQAGALPDPQLNAAFFLSPMMLPMGNQLGSISVMQMFPWPGTLPAMRAEAAQAAEVKNQERQVLRNALVFQVKSAWYPLLEVEARLRVLREQIRLLETDKALAINRFEQGMAPLTDPLRADIMLDDLRTELELLEQKRAPLAAAFNLLLNRAPDTPVQLPEGLPNFPAPLVSGAPDSLVAHHPALALMDRNIAMAEAEQAAAETMRKPMLGAGIQYMPLVRRKGDDVHLPPNTGSQMFMPMLTATVPIWRKKYDAAVEERRLMQEMYAHEKTAMGNELRAMYAMAAFDLEEAARRIELLDRQRSQTQQLIDLSLAAYRNDGQDFEEILRLQQQLFRYDNDKISALLAGHLARAKQEYFSGQ